LEASEAEAQRAFPHFIIRFRTVTFAEKADLFEVPSEFEEALRVSFQGGFPSAGRIPRLETETRDIVLTVP
jgi:hypothetical protein